MEVIHAISSIYPALWLGCIVIFAGAQNMPVLNYNNSFLRGEDVTLYCDFPRGVRLLNWRWYFTQKGTFESELANGTRYTWSYINISNHWVRIQISFKNVTITDSGKYTCEVTTDSDPVSGQLLLSVHEKPEITVPKTNYTAVSGTNVTLECIVNANSETITSIEWKYKLQQQWYPVTKSDTKSWTIQRPPLVISDVRRSDSSSYRCFASTQLITVEGSDIIYLKVQDLPLVTVQQTQFVIASGEDAVLNCFVDGRGAPINNVTWYRQSQGLLTPLSKNMKYGWRQLGPDASITISKAIMNDAGIYLCEATTEVGSSKGKDIELRVGYKPTVRVNEFNYSIGMEDNLTLHCSIDGHDSVVKNVQWFKEVNFRSKSLQSSTRVFWDISSPSLKINIVRLDDAGNYTCMGTTEFGTTNSQPISVQVFSKPSILIPVYEYQPKNGTTVVLEVRIDVRMQTLVSVRWEKYDIYKEDSQQWFPLENNSRLFWTYAEPSLKIATALVEDDGKYRIIGRTAYHEVTSSPITLVIYLPVKIKKLETKPVVIREGDKVEIRCLVDGRPEPRVTWRLANGTTIVPSSLENVQGNILILENVTNLNEGNYTCIAQNNFSCDESLIFLTVSDLPVINQQDIKDLNGSSLKKYVVPGVFVVTCVALITLIVVVILIRMKRLKRRTDKPISRIRSTNGQQQPSPTGNISSGNAYEQLCFHQSEDLTYAQVIRQSDTHIDGSNSTGDADTSQ